MKLDQVLKRGHDNPRTREHPYMDQRVRFTGVVVEVDRRKKVKGYKIELQGGSFGSSEGTISQNRVTYVYVDFRSAEQVPGYARCRFLGSYKTDAETLGIGDEATVTGIFRGYERADEGILAEFDSCRLD